jgi:hypothetical protein
VVLLAAQAVVPHKVLQTPTRHARGLPKTPGVDGGDVPALGEDVVGPGRKASAPRLSRDRSFICRTKELALNLAYRSCELGIGQVSGLS